MRPVAWSAPAFELRCGMFNTRERVDLVGGRAGGVLLGRPLLKNLNTAAGWTWGPDGIDASNDDQVRYLFLNGLVAADGRLVKGLWDLAQDGGEFLWRDEAGLVVALLSGNRARKLAAGWVGWEENCAAAGDWTDPSRSPDPWVEDVPGVDPIDPARLGGLADLQAAAPRWIWDLVSRTAQALMGDLDLVRDGQAYRRMPFGIFPAENGEVPDWGKESILKKLGSLASQDLLARLAIDDPDQIFVGDGVALAPGTALDTTAGPVILDRGVRVMPHCFLEGPLYVGPGSLVKPGTRLHGESSFGIVNRLAGEIAESTFGDFANKQHEGFIGHAVLGSWINLGAMTTCSDLKNNYGEIRVDLGAGAVATGSRFVGLMLGDHVKTAIGTLFNTGTSVGFASNVFGTGIPPKFIGNFQWGGQDECPAYAVGPAQATAAVAMSRRGCGFSAVHEELFRILAG